jgi:UDP-2,3-diacylglucosamine hydrolase
LERRLAVMAGAGVVPGRAAGEAVRQGWRVIALAFDQTADLDVHAERVVPSTITDIQAVLRTLADERVQAAVFVGKFWKQRVFDEVEAADRAGRELARAGLSDEALTRTVVETLGAMGIEVLDQRPFLSPWMMGPGALTLREPSPSEWEEIRAGFALARRLAEHGIGQTVVRSRGVTLAVEAAEGTDEAIRRGARLAGPGAVVVKAVASTHDFRFDVPTVGPATLAAMAEGGASALAVDGGKVLLVDRDEVVRKANRAGIAVVGLDDGR